MALLCTGHPPSSTDTVTIQRGSHCSLAYDVYDGSIVLRSVNDTCFFVIFQYKNISQIIPYPIIAIEGLLSNGATSTRVTYIINNLINSRDPMCAFKFDLWTLLCTWCVRLYVTFSVGQQGKSTLHKPCTKRQCVQLCFL